MNQKTLIVQKREAETSLRNFLADRLKISRNKAKDKLDTRTVFVNGRRTWMAHHTLMPNDKVDIINTLDTNRLDEIEILHKDNDYIIVNKPAGFLSNGINSVEEMLRVQMNSKVLSVAHRLDKDTSGALLVARNPSAFKKVVAIFKNKEIRKSYHAIVMGKLAHAVQSINTPINGEPASTRLKILDANNMASHLMIQIKTGRTHQIRKHLISIQHPILGDHHYATRTRLPPRYMNIGRQMLHASSIDFKHPLTHKRVQAKAPLPRDFRKCLKSFRLT